MSVPQPLDGDRLYYFTTSRSGSGRTVDDRAPEHVEIAYRAASARRLAAHQDTPPILPKPMAIHAVVVNDFQARTLYARLPDSMTGPGRIHWADAWQKLKLDEERGWGSRAPVVWAATPTAENVAQVTAGEGYQLKVFWPPEVKGYGELIRTPLRAIATVDREQRWFLRLSFFHR